MASPNSHPISQGISVGSLQNFTSGDITSKVLREGLKEVLQKSVLYDRDEVEDMVLIPSTRNAEGDQSRSGKDSRLSAIVKYVQEHCKDSLKTLEDLATQASPPNNAKKSEREMYGPLEKIIGAIEQKCITQSNASRRQHFRQLISKGETPPLSDDPVTPNAFKVKPDFLLAERAPPAKGGKAVNDDKTAVHWRQCPAFFEIKASSTDSTHPATQNMPVADNPDVVKATLRQGADYARIIFSCRPFQLYVFGLFLCGRNFCLGYFDRRGVILSRQHSLFDADGEGLTLFVRIIIRFIWEMSPTDLGHDPSVTLLKGFAYYDDKFPRVSIQTPQSNNTYTTFGGYIWSSHSYLGRGTYVFPVAETGPGIDHPGIRMLKTAWRLENRLGEAQIYENIRQIFNNDIPGGIAKSSVGGDVHFPGGEEVSIHALRSDSEELYHDTPNAILHRVVLDDLGKPLWKYTDGEQLIRAMLAAVKGHQSLCDAEILHRDISVGNIMIRVDPFFETPQGRSNRSGDLDKIIVKRKELPVTSEGYAERVGFLTDFEMAGLPGNLDWVGADPTTIPNAEMTGTAIFMATDLLKSFAFSQSGSTVQRIVSHDLQSFYWVIIYAAFKNTIDKISSAGTSITNGIPGFDHDLFEKEYGRLFGASSAIGLVDQRRAAFGTERSGPPGKVGSSEDPTTCAGIGNLYAYLKSKKRAFADWIAAIWMLLRECEPPLILSSGEILSKVTNYVNVYLAKPSAAVGPGTKVISSDYAKHLDHAQVIGVLELGLELLADGANVSDKVDEGSA